MTAARDSEIDTALLADWFLGADIEFAEPLSPTLITGGRSNLTYRVVDSRGKIFVLRRPPKGEVLQSAHDMSREFRVLQALAPTRLPVPAPLRLCTDDAVLGAHFYVMTFVPGAVIANDDDGASYAPAARARASCNLIDALAEIHQVDVDAVGLGSLGRKDNYSARQLRRWLRQFHASTSREVPMIDTVHDRLVASMPPQRYTGLVHGDFRPGNVLLSSEGRVQAVLDWELATLGDTLADLGWMIATWREPGEAELFESPSGHKGWLTRAELIARYEARTGRDLTDLWWYQAFALWRLACIFEGVYTRYRSGVMGTDGADVEAQGDLVLRLAAAASDALDGMVRTHL
jgi:aminoglycoside phosphotransferase (APT) family kinase protein